MCPACLATAVTVAWIAAGAASTAGFGAVAMRVSARKTAMTNSERKSAKENTNG